jgi:hypothetical protein
MALQWNKVLDQNTTAADVGAVDTDLSNAPASIKNSSVTLSKDGSGNISISGGGVGSIILGASDVGARPTSWTPSKSDIGLGNVANESRATILGGTFTGNVTGTIAGDSAATIKSGATLGSSSNQDSTSTIRAGVTATDVGLGNVENKSAATIMAGTFTGNIGGVAAATIKSGASAGTSAKSAVDGNSPITIVGGSINIGSGNFTVDSSGNIISDGGIDLINDGTGHIDLNMWGANPTINVGGTSAGSPIGTGSIAIFRGGTGNQHNIYYYTGTTLVFAHGVSNKPTSCNTMWRLHHGGTYDDSVTPKQFDFSLDDDGKIGFWKNTKTFAGVTIGSDGTNSGLYVENDLEVGGALTVGGSGDTSNNWISIYAQDGGETSGGGITFYETGTYSKSAPQYGAKIVYDENADYFWIGTMSDNIFMKQLGFSRASNSIRTKDIIPQTSATYSVGTSSTKFKDLYLSGTAYINGVAASTVGHLHSGSHITSGTVAAARIHDDAKAWHGHAGIIIKPADFIPNDDQSYYNVAMVDNGGQIKVTSSSLEAYAQYEIPNGYKATHVKLYGSDSGNPMGVYEHSISTATASSRTSGMPFVNTENNITDIVGSSTTYMSVKWVPSATNDYLYGGYITLAKV